MQPYPSFIRYSHLFQEHHIYPGRFLYFEIDKTFEYPYYNPVPKPCYTARKHTSLAALFTMLPYPQESTIPAGPSSEARKPSPDVEFGRKFKRKNITSRGDPFAYLRHFDTAFLIDDSESMKDYWDEVRALLNAIADLCVTYDENGIDVYFVNHRPADDFFRGNYGYKNIGNTNGMLEFHDNVAGIFHNVKPKGKCRLDRALRHIFQNYMTALEKKVTMSFGKRGTKPLNLIVISAGYVDGNPFKELLKCAEWLDKLGAPPYQVGVQLFQIGNDERVRENWEYADNELAQKGGSRDMIDTVT